MCRPGQQGVHFGPAPTTVGAGESDRLSKRWGTDSTYIGVEKYYIHTDHLNTPRRISRASDNQIVWRWDNDPFGRHTANEDPDGDSQLFTFALRYPGQYYDEETGLHYNYFRDYDPATGRYIESDPIGLRAGLNTYSYVYNSPLKYIDHYGLTALTYDNASGTLTVDPQNGQSPYTIPASSGRDGSTDQTKKNEGPIPSGEYTGDNRNLTNPGLFGDLLRNTQGDWRMPLTPNSGTNTYGRDGFFIHGGRSEGSAGCIDLGGGILGNDDTDRLLKDILNDPDGYIPVKVVQ
ncbi:RHS repeat-associated protein [Marinobacterium sp. MBR-111]